MTTETATTTGIVKWFNNTKGFGFINMDGEDEDIFVHFSAIRAEGFRKLKRGQTVDFVLERGPNGLQALEVLANEEEELETAA